MTTELTKKDKMIDQHEKLMMSIALQAIRIVEMQKYLVKQSDELLALEVQIERIEAEEKGSGLN